MTTTPEERWLEDQLSADEFRLLFKVAELSNDLEHSQCLQPWRQAEIGGAGRMDLFVTSQGKRTAVVFELKRVADEGAVAQVLRYCGALNLYCDPLEIVVQATIVAFSVTNGALLAGLGAGCVTFVTLSLGEQPIVIHPDKIHEWLGRAPVIPAEIIAEFALWKRLG